MPDNLEEIKKKEIKRSTGRIYLFILLFLYMFLSAPTVYNVSDVGYRIAYMILWIIALLSLGVAANIEAKVVKGLKKK